VPSTPGKYYLVAASEGVLSGGVASSTSEFTITAQTNYPISLQLSNNGGVSYSTNVTSTVGSEIYFEGSGFTSTSTITMAVFTISGGSPVNAFTITAPAPSSGEISGNFYVASDPAGYYYVIAYDSGSKGGLATGQSILGVKPSVSPVLSIPAGSISFSTTLYGTGFPASSTFAPSTQAKPSNTVTIGGVDALLSGTPTASAGSVTFSIIGLASALTTTGPYTVTVNDQQGHSFSFPDQAYVSSLTGVPTLIVYDTTFGTTSGNVGDTLTAVMFNFPALATASVSLDGQSFTMPSTDGNGFATGTLKLADTPGGAYTVFASAGGEYASAQFTVLPMVEVTDSSGNNLDGEYAVAGSTVTVTATGLAPLTEYAVTDTALASEGISSNLAYNAYEGILTVTVTAGTAAKDNMGYVSDATGTITLSYELTYTGIATGTNETISVGSVGSAYYFAVGKGTITGIASSYAPTSGTHTTVVTFTVSGLVPAGQFYTPETSSSSTGVTGPFSVTLGTYKVSSAVPLTLSTQKPYFTVPSSAPVTVSFNLPSADSAGVYELAISSAASTFTLVAANYNFIVSAPGTGAESFNVPLSTGSNMGAYTGQTLVYDLYNFPASTSVSAVYYSNLGRQVASVSTDSNGAATFTLTVPDATAGAYSIQFIAGSLTPVTATYTIAATLSFDSSPFASSHYKPAIDYLSYFGVNAYPGENVTFYAYSLVPNTLYSVYFSSSTSAVSADYVTYFVTDEYGNGPSTGVTVTLPTEVPGTYNLGVIAGGVVSSSTSMTDYVTVEMGGYNVIYSGLNYTTNEVPAFPGEIVTYSWAPPTTAIMPISPGTAYANGFTGTEYSYGPIYVTVYLNGTSYTTAPAAFVTIGGTIYLNGSFLAPNAAPGTWWYVTFSWSQTVTTITLVGGSPSSTTGASYVYQNSGSGTPKPVAKLVVAQGNGALLTGISSSEIATIEAQLSSTISTTLQVPLSELSANITALHGDIVQITTAFGTMTTTLQAINATVESISSGQALVLTDLGSIKTSLASLNASIAAFNGNIVTINTTLGQVETTLAGINTQVTTNGNGIATIKTDLGTLTGVVTATNGTVSTIKTNLGNLTTTVGKINTNTQGFSTLEIFLIVAIVLILITLVIAFLAVSNTNKLSKKFEEQKKQ